LKILLKSILPIIEGHPVRCIKTCPGKVICALLRVLFIVISPCFLTGAIFTCIRTT